MTLDASGALTVDQARAKAREVLAEVALGRDPQAERSERRDRDGNTMRALVGHYLAARKDEVRPRTMQATAARGRIRKSRQAKTGGPTCLQTLALASASGAPISPSSERSIGLPTKSERSYLSRAASAIGGPRLRATN
jgi:Arm DNA-binding domain